MKFTHYDPENLRTCNHCQHTVLDLGRGIICRVYDVVISPQDIHKVVECESWKSPYENDYRKRPDLEKKLKKGQSK